MTRLALLPWYTDVCGILGHWPDMHNLEDMECDPTAMWRAGLTPVEAAAAITVAEFERSLNA